MFVSNIEYVNSSLKVTYYIIHDEVLGSRRAARSAVTTRTRGALAAANVNVIVESRHVLLLMLLLVNKFRFITSSHYFYIKSKVLDEKILQCVADFYFVAGTICILHLQ